MQNAWAIGAEPVIEWYNSVARSPYYSLWNGRQIVFSWPEDDETKGKDLLETNLRAFQDQGITDIFVLKIHPILDKSGYITDKSPVTASLNFRPTAQFNPAQIAGGELVFPRNAGMQALADQIKELKDELSNREEETPAVSADHSVMGAIDRVLSIPGVSEAVQPLIMGLTANLMKSLGMPAPDQSQVHQAPAAPVQAAAMGAISEDQEEKINQALDILEPMAPELGDDLLRLAALAQKDPAQFKMLLNMLKANG